MWRAALGRSAWQAPYLLCPDQPCPRPHACLAGDAAAASNDAKGQQQAALHLQQQGNQNPTPAEVIVHWKTDIDRFNTLGAQSRGE